MDILLVENNSISRLATQCGLEIMGYNFELIECDRATLTVCERQFDLIMVTLTLPDLNAMDIIREIRLKEDKRNTIIGLSNCSHDLKTLYLRAGFDGIYPKPWSMHELTNIIKKWELHANEKKLYSQRSFEITKYLSAAS